MLPSQPRSWLFSMFYITEPDWPIL
jgi:hypothetical protein